MNRLVVPTAVLLGAAAAQATILHRLVPVDNSDGRPTDFDYYTWDLRFDVSPSDDWATAQIIATIEVDEIARVAFNPRQERLRPPQVRGSPPPEWMNRYGNMVSTPQDWPNTLDNSKSTLGTVAVSHSDSAMEATWFDTSMISDVSFTAFRLTLRQTAGLPALTLEGTSGDVVARINGMYYGRGHWGFPYAFTIYRIPEPGALALLGLGGLAGLSSLGSALRRD
jgi:hypothetical protein